MFTGIGIHDGVLEHEVSSGIVLIYSRKKPIETKFGTYIQSGQPQCLGKENTACLYMRQANRALLVYAVVIERAVHAYVCTEGALLVYPCSKQSGHCLSIHALDRRGAVRVYPANRP